MSNFKYEIFSSSSLPKEGWLQSCIYCRTFTSKIYKMIYEKNELNIYLCNTCKKKKFHLENEFYNRVIYKYELITNRLSSSSSDSSSESENDNKNDFFDNQDNLPHYLKKEWILNK